MISYYDRLVELNLTKGMLSFTPNFADQITSFDNVIVGALRYYTIDSSLATTTTSPLILTQTHNFGSGSASASDKLYLYRFIQTTTPNDSPVIDEGIAFCQIPSLRFVLNADLNKEADYQYLMRLKRSLDLYQEGLWLSYYYTPLQKKGQRFFEEYIPLERIYEESLEPDYSFILADPTPVSPSPELDPNRILVFEGLRRLSATPVGRGILIGAYALSYLPLLEPTQTAKTYDEGELMVFQSGLGGALIV